VIVTVYRGGRYSKPCRDCGEPITLCRVVGTDRYRAFEADPVALRLRHDETSQGVIEDLDAQDAHYCGREEGEAHEG